MRECVFYGYMVTVSTKAFIHKGLRAYPNRKKARLRMVILVTTGELLGLTKIEKQDNKPIILYKYYYYQIIILQISVLLSV